MSDLQSLEHRVQMLEGRVNRSNIEVGNGLLKQENGETTTITLAEQPDQIVNYHPWKLMQETIDSRVQYSVYGGTVNSTLAENWNNIITVDQDDDTALFVYWRATYNSVNLNNIRINASPEYPKIDQLYGKNSIPSMAIGLIGVIKGNVVMYQFAKNNIFIGVNLAMSVNDSLGGIDNYYNFVITEL